jgi:hypothetical protein
MELTPQKRYGFACKIPVFYGPVILVSLKQKIIGQARDGHHAASYFRNAVVLHLEILKNLRKRLANPAAF